MELTLNSALSFGGMVGHLSYLLLVLSMLMRVMWLLRVLAIASSLTGIIYIGLWVGDPVGLSWEVLLIAVNLGQLTISYIKNRRMNFNDEEASFVDRQFPGLPKMLKRQLLDLGRWRDYMPGDVLTREDKAVDDLVYLSSGRVEISINGAKIAVCEPGSFVGEMTVFSGEPANGTATVCEITRSWSINAEDLRRITDRNSEIDQAVKACFHRTLLEKLIRSNKLIEGIVTRKETTS